jgi:hypothetical protein
MSSVKLSSSGGGSVSLSAASTSTDVTIKFPSGNSSAGQALVASNTSGELDWETVPNSAAVPLLRLSAYNTPTTSDYIGGVPGRPLEWYVGANNVHSVFETDTHSAWDATNYWYVVPQAGFYRVSHSFCPPTVPYSDNTKVHVIQSFITCSPAANKTSWTDKFYINRINRRYNDSSFTSCAHSEIIECAVGDAIKTSFLWDKHTDTNNTTTAVAPRATGLGNTFFGHSLSIEFVRPS